jgi:delta(3,5)-delta(2,4)-dienoyl-CoA isomerase
MDRVMFRELLTCFREIHDDKQCRAVVISGAGKLFSVGRDEDDRKEIVVHHPYDKDIARKAKYLRSKIGL